MSRGGNLLAFRHGCQSRCAALSLPDCCQTESLACSQGSSNDDTEDLLTGVEVFRAWLSRWYTQGNASAGCHKTVRLALPRPPPPACFPRATWITFCNGAAAAAGSACRSGGTTTGSTQGKRQECAAWDRRERQDHPFQQQPQLPTVRLNLFVGCFLEGEPTVPKSK